jgi:hypothetical protein
MLKLYIILTISIIIILAISIGSLYYLQYTADNLTVNLRTLEKSITQEEWHLAADDFSTTYAQWNKYRHIWPIIIDHSKVAEISKIYIDLQQSIKYADLPRASQEIQTLLYLVYEIPATEKLSWQNIF